MSLSVASSSALSGLTAATRGTELVSTNIANKSVAGYARRELDLASSVAGAGVNIVGVRRILTTGLLADDRIAQAASARSATVAAFHQTMETAIGTANDDSSLSSMLTAFDASLASASARPDSEVRLSQVLEAARALTDKLNRISFSIQDARTAADAAIATDVSRLGTALDKVAELNRQIVVLGAQGQDPSSLVDTRQAVIDEISGIIPIQEVARENGRVALFSKGGATLLDGTTPARVEFRAAGTVTPDMTAANGTLSTISLNGEALDAAQMSVFSGGSLAANFDIRDSLAPAQQSQIDAFAREIYVRLSDPGVDPGLTAGQHGLFTDSQSDLLAANEAGFASRIGVTSAVDPAQGGQLWKLRSGINAVTPAEAGESGIFLAMSSALAASRTPASASVSTSPRTLLTFSAEIASQTASARLGSETAAAQDQSRSDALRTARLAEGVDTDTEMTSLLFLEKAYSANAKVLQTVNDMLDQILRLT